MKLLRGSHEGRQLIVFRDMVEPRRRSLGEDAIYFDHRGPCRDALKHRHCAGRWLGVVSLGFDADGKRIRKKVYGRTKTVVKDKLRDLHENLGEGIAPSGTYTVRQACGDWLQDGLDGRSAKTVRDAGDALKPILAVIGSKALRELTAADVRQALMRSATTRSTRTVEISRNCLVRAIRHAEANDRVRRNVAALVQPPRGQQGRPSKAMTLEQVTALLEAARKSRLHAYVVVSLTTGVRTEEARALRWDHVDLLGRPDADPPVPPHVAVWRSVRAHGDVKTEKSRRTLALPRLAVEALEQHQQQQQAKERLRAGTLWQEHGLVFASSLGTPLDASHVRRALQGICKDAGIGEGWAPRDFRHTFVSIMSSLGDVPVEEIARLTGHSDSRTTETVYRHELRPVIRTGAEVMDRLLGEF
jgi:integrase